MFQELIHRWNAETGVSHIEKPFLNRPLINFFFLIRHFLELTAIALNDIFFFGPSKHKVLMLFEQRRHHHRFHKITRFFSLREGIGQMGKLNSSHEFIEPNSSVFSEKNFFCEISLRVVGFKKIDEFVENIFMHFRSHCHSYLPICSDLFKGIFLCVNRVLVKIDVIPWSFDCIKLGEGCFLLIVKLNILTLFPRSVVKVVDAMGELAILLGVETQSSEIESTE